jgi:hypothetical protein
MLQIRPSIFSYHCCGYNYCYESHHKETLVGAEAREVRVIWFTHPLVSLTAQSVLTGTGVRAVLHSQVFMVTYLKKTNVMTILVLRPPV